jgi:hypothetical protein
MSERRQDPQDKQFGAQARRDAEVVDELDREGVREEKLSDDPAAHPRAADRARPEDG